MPKFLSVAVMSLLVLPAAASAASLNLGATVAGVNKNLGVKSSAVYASAATPMIAAIQGNPCPIGGCPPDPAQCPTSPENPTALLAVLGASGLLLGRLGYGRMRTRRFATSAAL